MLIYRDELVLRALFWRYTFPRDKIVEIVPYQVLLSPGIKIEHTILEYPRFVVFWTFDLSDLLGGVAAKCISHYHTTGLTNRWSQPLAVVKSRFDFMRQFRMLITLAVASGGSAPSR